MSRRAWSATLLLLVVLLVAWLTLMHAEPDPPAMIWVRYERYEMVAEDPRRGPNGPRAPLEWECTMGRRSASYSVPAGLAARILAFLGVRDLATEPLVYVTENGVEEREGAIWFHLCRAK
jgi:hypothetical protein